MLRSALLALFLSGCAVFGEQPPYWVKTWEGALTYDVYRVVSPWGEHVHGWTSCNKARRHCDIYITPSADYDCTLAHELRHKDGFDHPDYRTSLGCYRPWPIHR